MDEQIADVRALHAQIQQWRQEERLDMAAHHAENKAEMEALRREMLALSAMMKTGYPDGDLDGHRRYHETVIEREAQRKKIREGVIMHLAKTSTLAAVSGLLFLVIMRVKEWILK